MRVVWPAPSVTAQPSDAPHLTERALAALSPPASLASCPAALAQAEAGVRPCRLSDLARALDSYSCPHLRYEPVARLSLGFGWSSGSTRWYVRRG